MSLEYNNEMENWAITKNELVNNNCCSVCKRKLDFKNFYRCEITKKFFCEDCNKELKMERCAGLTNTEHEHNCIRGVVD